MKRELWKNVKVGSLIIYADEYEGVFRGKVTEIDIRIMEEGPPSRWGHPYGLTKTTGTVRILYNKSSKIENLANLVAYGTRKYAVLRRDWSQWRRQKAASDALQATFRARVTEYRAY